MKRSGLIMLLLVVLAVSSVLALSYKSRTIPMTGYTTTVTIGGDFKTPMLLTSLYVMMPSANVDLNSFAWQLGRGACTSTVWTASFTNGVFILPTPGFTVDFGDVLIFTNSVTNGIVVLNYETP